MIALHGTWKPSETIDKWGKFFIWGESTTASTIKRTGRPPKISASTPRPHPFQAPYEDLNRVMAFLENGNGSIIGNWTYWWSKRRASILESFGWSNRLERGRRYARKGQVPGFEISAGKVEAKVQGPVRKPYSVTIEIKPITEKSWDHVIEEMSQKAIFTAKLLAGEMPDDIEEAFEAADIPLFPEKSNDIKTHCSCPDSANPCKHIAALYYILAEEFDHDPFMIFELRGRTKDNIIAALRKRRTIDYENPPEPETLPVGAEQEEVALSMDDFWGGEKLNRFQLIYRRLMYLQRLLNGWEHHYSGTVRRILQRKWAGIMKRSTDGLSRPLIVNIQRRRRNETRE